MGAPVNPVLLYHTDAYRTARSDLKGRHSAGESFLTAYLAQASPGEVYALCDVRDMFREFAHEVASTGRPLTARPVGREDFAVLRRQGLLHLPQPQLPEEARLRGALGDDAYALCGVTHTISSRVIIEAVAQLAVAPVMPWDAIICTSEAVRRSLTAVIEAAEEHLRARVGATRFTRPMLPVIPLGIHADRFNRNETDRQRWRARLGLAPEAVAILFFGRLSVHAKASPFQLAQAAEIAAQQAPHPLAIVWSGWFANDYQRNAFMSAAQAMAPSVAFHHVDGREADVRFSIWSAADIFCSLSDNVQETFGLTVVEAMAAGLPVIASDWDGYRDTVKHGVTGVLVDSYFPAAPLADLAYRYIGKIDTYDQFVGALSQYCFVDLAQTAHWIARLAADAPLRQRLADAGRQAARSQFDWAAVLPHYRDLWAAQVDALEQARRGGRSSSTPATGIDPATMFAGYPSRSLAPGSRLGTGGQFARWDDLVREPGIIINRATLLSGAEYRMVRDWFADGASHAVETLLARTAPERRAVMLRSLYWLVKVGLLRRLAEDDPPTTDGG